MHTVPDPACAHVQDFCKWVAPDGTPTLVECRPVPRKPLKECFSIVPEHIAAHGGAQLIGWAIWEWPKVLIEAEFHTVWQSPGGEIIDLTPNAIFSRRTFFLPDTDKQYTGRQVDNIRKPLTKDWDITRLIFLHKRYSEILNQGDLADKYGEIVLTGKVAGEVAAMQKEMAHLNRRLTKRYD